MALQIDPTRYYIEFTWGGARLARARDLEGAKAEAEMAAEATQSRASVLASNYAVLGRTDHTGKFQLAKA